MKEINKEPKFLPIPDIGCKLCKEHGFNWTCENCKLPDCLERYKPRIRIQMLKDFKKQLEAKRGV